MRHGLICPVERNHSPFQLILSKAKEPKHGEGLQNIQKPVSRIIQKDGFHEITILGKLLQEGIADELLVALEKNLEKGELNYLLNLSELSYVNSSGIALFIRILTKIRTKGGELVVHNPNSIIQKSSSLKKIAI